jgi:HK97 family phage major capsid protein
MTHEEFLKLPKADQDAILAKSEEIQKTLEADKSTAKPINKDEMTEIMNMAMEKNFAKMTPIDKKYLAFPGVDPKTIDNQTDTGKFIKMTKFLNAMVKKDVQVLQTMSDDVRKKAAYGNEATGSEGAYLVPEEFASEVLRLAVDYGVARKDCRKVPMRYDTMNFPAAGTTVASAHWTNEASQIYGTFPDFKQVILTIKKLATLPKMSSELLRDSNVDVQTYLQMLIAQAFAKQEDTQCFCGVGAPFVGAMNATGIGTYTHIGGSAIVCLSYTDLALIPANMYPMAQNGAKYYFHRSIMYNLMSIVTSAGAPIFPQTGVNQAFGYPIQYTEVLPGLTHTAAATDNTTYAIFGNFGMGMLMGERGGLEMKLIEEGTVGADNLAEKDLVALRVIERICFGVALPSCFISIQT